MYSLDTDHNMSLHATNNSVVFFVHRMCITVVSFVYTESQSALLVCFSLANIVPQLGPSSSHLLYTPCKALRLMCVREDGFEKR